MEIICPKCGYRIDSDKCEPEKHTCDKCDKEAKFYYKEYNGEWKHYCLKHYEETNNFEEGKDPILSRQ